MGKTLQAIAVARHYRREWPLLVLCPTSMAHTWADELERWCPELVPGQINLIKSHHNGALSSAAVTMLSITSSLSDVANIGDLTESTSAAAEVPTPESDSDPSLSDKRRLRDSAVPSSSFSDSILKADSRLHCSGIYPGGKQGQKFRVPR